VRTNALTSWAVGGAANNQYSRLTFLDGAGAPGLLGAVPYIHG
jgi:hypothetical protein